MLVVNDNEDLLATMRDVLELGGATVQTAISSKEALAILASGFDPTVFVIDLILGGGERGQNFARLLRSDRRYAHKPIVFLSGDIHQLRMSDPALADATVGKPFGIDELFAILTDLCAKAQRGSTSPLPSPQP